MKNLALKILRLISKTTIFPHSTATASGMKHMAKEVIKGATLR